MRASGVTDQGFPSMLPAPVSGNRSLLFAITVFTSAFLLFQVQPLLAKFILPWFGGTPAVWTMCMLVFQLLLFGGYAYAHLLSSLKSVSRQACIHATLLAVAVFSLPIIPDVAWKPMGDETPSLRITLLLLATVGMPYFLLSATGPLLQQWFSRACTGVSPYRLYALSNIGSLLALVSYPFLFEPMFSSTMQAGLWSALFVVFALSCLLCGWTTAIRSQSDLPTDTVTDSRQEETAPSYARWFILAMLPSVMLLATTNEVCMDIAVVPFLWIIPLTLYLLSFILTFESDRFYNRRIMTLITTASLVATILMMAVGTSFGVVLQIIAFFMNLFLICMLCHGELVQLKPNPRRLTSFYLTISAGGAAGGLFVGLLAPMIFNSYCELPLGIFSCLLICAGTWLRSDPQFQKLVPPATTLKFGAGLILAMTLYMALFTRPSSSTRVIERNFYGVLRVDDVVEAATQRLSRDMVHGRVVHGRQFLDEAGRRQPATYYSLSSGAGRVLAQPKLHENSAGGRRVGVVGLGAGTLAVYGRPGDHMRFYEINPDVIDLAWEHFTFLEDCEAEVKVLPGDARLVLEQEPNQQFDVLVLDAFSGDAIPVHLLTTEAMQIYSRHLSQDGVLAVHISNSYFDLEPVVRALGNEFGLSARVQACERGVDGGVALESVWMLLCREPAVLTKALGPAGTTVNSRTVLWTDDRNNLLNVLR
jgi:hypothetical protein